ncbi:MAG: DUF573 domain-containing protein [Sweet potato little leaf phytoplasma]|nr:DUF573 domain-containing protein [Sweet potato little leaf phytoplasma]
MLDFDSNEDKSDTEYKIELESSDDEESSDSYECRKRRKKRSGLLFQWEEDDEITVLKELYEFSGNNASYSKPFYDYVKNRLRKRQLQVSINQLRIKIDGFKKEYLEKKEYLKENAAFKFSEAHEFQVFMLSKRIWGADQKNKDGSGSMKNVKGLVEYLQEMEIDISCLMPSCLEYLKKEWQLQLLMYIHLLSIKSKFDAKFRQLLMFNKVSQ